MREIKYVNAPYSAVLICELFQVAYRVCIDQALLIKLLLLSIRSIDHYYNECDVWRALPRRLLAQCKKIHQLLGHDVCELPNIYDGCCPRVVLPNIMPDSNGNQFDP